MNEFENLNKGTNSAIDDAPTETIDNDVYNANAEVSESEETISDINLENNNTDFKATEDTQADSKACINDESPKDNTDNFVKKANGKKKYSYKSSVIAGLAGVVLCGASFGFFLGVGLNTSGSVVGGVSSVASGNFSFDSDAVKSETTSAQPVNLVADEDSIAATIASVENSVVNISIKTTSTTFFNQTYESEGAGSGIIYKIDGDKIYIVTNNHVIEDASSVTVSVTGDEQVSAKLVGKDASADIAVISVSKKDMENAGIKDIKAAKFNKDGNEEVGESVIAIGNALGRGKTATLGIISAKNKEINIDGKNFNVIQTDAAINPGNSGGALIDTNGEVIGINTAKLSDSSVEGTGYAIPSSTAVEIADQLITNGSVQKAYLGISGASITDDIKKIYGITTDGVLITNVEDGSAADNGGIQRFDIITAVDGTKITKIEDLSKVITSHKPNDTIKISIIRNGAAGQVTVTLQDANSSF